MSATNFPSAPKNLPPLQEDPVKSVPDENQLKFNNALGRAFDILFYQISHLISQNSPKYETCELSLQQRLQDLWQDCVYNHQATSPDTRKKHPQLYLRFYAGDHIDLLNGPAGSEIDIPLNKAGKPIKFTASTVLSKNCSDFRQYVKDKSYLPNGLCLLVFRQKQNWTYSIVITRDQNGPPLSDWD